MPMSLAFGSLQQIADALCISNIAYDFIDTIVNKRHYRGLTFVARPTTNNYYKLSKECLYVKDGTVGARLTDSEIETRLAGFQPIPTTPVIDDDGHEVGDGETALRLVRERMQRKGIKRELNALSPVCVSLSLTPLQSLSKNLVTSFPNLLLLGTVVSNLLLPKIIPSLHSL